VSDRQEEVLNSIDMMLDAADEDWTVSGDAMRWMPADEEETFEVEGGAKITHFPGSGYMILDEHLYIEATGRLYAHPPRRRPVDRFSFTRAATNDSIPVRISHAEAVIPGPNGPIHIRGAYGNEPAQITEIDLDDIEGEQQ